MYIPATILLSCQVVFRMNVGECGVICEEVELFCRFNESDFGRYLQAREIFSKIFSLVFQMTRKALS